MSLHVSCLLLPACGLALATSAFAANFDETTAGDISNLRLDPTTLALEVGNNEVRGGYGRPDLDYLHVHVPHGFVLSELLALPGTTVGGGRAFIGVQQGTTFSVASDVAEPGDMLGYTHIDFVLASRDLLGDMAVAFGAQGFSGPLPAGDYTFWIQELATGSFAYALDFVLVPVASTPPLQQVPAASPWGLSLLAGCLLLMALPRLSRFASA